MLQLKSCEIKIHYPRMDSDKRKDLGWGSKRILNINWGDTASSDEEKEEHPETQITKVPTHHLKTTKE